MKNKQPSYRLFGYTRPKLDFKPDFTETGWLHQKSEINLLKNKDQTIVMDIDDYLKQNKSTPLCKSVNRYCLTQLEEECLPPKEIIFKPRVKNTNYLKLYHSKQEKGSDSESP